MSQPATTTTRPAKSARVPAIDMFRGLAVLLVVLYHISGNILFPEGWGLARGADGAAHIQSAGLLVRLLFLPFHMGRVGVNLFFVISGLCIHMRVARDKATGVQRPFGAGTFFARRFFRIYPAYWTALAIGIATLPLLSALSPSGTYVGLGVATARNIALHVFMLHSFFKDTIMTIIRPLWSIAIEEQFYILYPLVFVWLGRRLPIGKIVLGLLAFTVAWRVTFILTQPPPQTFSDGPFLVWVFGFSLPRYFEWSLGALLAEAMATGRTVDTLPVPRFLSWARRPPLMIALGLGCIFAGTASLASVRLKWLVEDPLYGTGWFLILTATLLPATAGARAAASASAPTRWIARRLENLGLRSYSVYLLHELPLIITTVLMTRWGLPRFWVAAPLAGLFIWAVCYPFYAFVEKPTEARSKRVGQGKPVAAALASPFAPTDAA